MKRVGAFEAKTHLSELLEDAERGEEIVITRRGQPVARLMPLRQVRTKLSLSETVQHIRSFAQTHSLKGIGVRTLINEGRKY